jgi:hypothetical protein
MPFLERGISDAIDDAIGDFLTQMQAYGMNTNTEALRLNA